MKICVTGGRGFIGTNFVKYLMTLKGITEVIILDALTYAARPYLVKKDRRITEVNVDIRDQLAMKRFMDEYKPDHIFHFAAESHVCRSIKGPKDFITTNINGTWNLLEEFKELWKDEIKSHRFLHVSTDEVYGQIKKGKFTETSPINPRSPYAASKAASDHLVLSYAETYGMDAVVVNCSNNFGPNQHEEKLVPKTILKILLSEPVEVYQSGKQVRDWLYVEDACEGIFKVFQKGLPGERYNLGGDYELTNLEMISAIHEEICSINPKQIPELKMRFTNSRPTDDLRYALDISKARKIGWKPNKSAFRENLRFTVMWYWKRMMREGRAATQGRV